MSGNNSSSNDDKHLTEIEYTFDSIPASTAKEQTNTLKKYFYKMWDEMDERDARYYKQHCINRIGIKETVRCFFRDVVLPMATKDGVFAPLSNSRYWMYQFNNDMREKGITANGGYKTYKDLVSDWRNERSHERSCL